MITKNDINPKFLFILDMYGATDEFVKKFLENERNNHYVSLRHLNEKENFKDFILCSFLCDDYWFAIADQDEDAIKFYL